MKAPQIIIIVLVAIELLYVSNKHGEDKEREYNIWTSLISQAILIGLLIWGGFFK